MYFFSPLLNFESFSYGFVYIHNGLLFILFYFYHYYYVYGIVFKDGGKEEKKKNPTTSAVKCYFVRMESDAYFDKIQPYKLSNRTVFEARSLFMHAHMVSSVASYMARYAGD